MYFHCLPWAGAWNLYCTGQLYWQKDPPGQGVDPLAFPDAGVPTELVGDLWNERAAGTPPQARVLGSAPCKHVTCAP